VAIALDKGEEKKPGGEKKGSIDFHRAILQLGHQSYTPENYRGGEKGREKDPQMQQWKYVETGERGSITTEKKRGRRAVSSL